jgi:hypothetical protein
MRPYHTNVDHQSMNAFVMNACYKIDDAEISEARSVLHLADTVHDISAQLRHCPTSRKVVGSAPDEATAMFSIDLITPTAQCRWNRLSL